MAIKVTKPGELPETIFEGTCKRCQCSIECEKSDISIHNEAKCPCCGDEHLIVQVKPEASEPPAPPKQNYGVHEHVPADRQSGYGVSPSVGRSTPGFR